MQRGRAAAWTVQRPDTRGGARSAPRRAARAAGIAGAAWLAAAGCAAPNALTVEQPFARPSQRRIELRSDWGYGDLRDGRRRCLLAFPLPGSRGGPRDFFVYLDLPASNGRHAVDPADPGAARGFFIQRKGELRGITYVTGGQVEVRGVWLRPGLRNLALDLSCDDQTRIRGRARVESAPSELQTFETRHAADVARLAPAASQPSTTGEATEPRPAPGG